MLSINRSSFWGKAAVLLLAAGGGTGLYLQQSDLNNQRQATASLERKIEESELNYRAALTREREARGTLERSAIAQARIFDERLQQAQNAADDASSANKDLSDRLDEREQTIEDLQTTIGRLNQRLGTAIGMEQVTEIVNKSAPAAVNISYKDQDGNDVLLAGSIIRANGKRYLLTIGHGQRDVVHWLNQELTIKMFNGFTFKMKPRPFEDGSIPYFQSTGGDLALSELPANIDAQIPQNIGLEIRSASEPPRYGEPILVVGNPLGLNSSISIGFVRHPGRYMVVGGRLYSNQAQLTELDGGNSGGPVISLRDGKLIAVSGWVRGGGRLPHGFGSNNVNIASLIDGTFKIPIMTPEDRFNVGIRNFAARFQMPTPLVPIPFGNFLPVANEPKEMANIRFVEPLSRFMMPTPSAPLLQLRNFYSN